mmetsp:Transcript_20679/g.45020  ORF Transcript_20679/g.45020 Transcript_20679/m.45020 type:complete len:87 (-) Transcript_20679:37-297(-)
MAFIIANEMTTMATTIMATAAVILVTTVMILLARDAVGEEEVEGELEGPDEDVGRGDKEKNKRIFVNPISCSVLYTSIIEYCSNYI